MKYALAALLLLVVARSAAAQKSGPGEKAFDGPEVERVFRILHGWHEFEKNAWVEVRVIRREGDRRTEHTERRTLRGVEKDGTAMVAVTGVSDPTAAVLVSVEDVCVPQDDCKHERHEQEEMGGVLQSCMVFSTAESESAKRSGETLRFWIGHYVPTPGSVIRSERRRADGTSLHREVASFNVFVEIGGRRVMGTAFKEIEARAGKSGEIRTEEIESPDVPGGIVSRRGKGWVLRAGVKTDIEIEEVVTSFGEDASGLDVKTRRACDEVRALLRHMPSPWRGFGEGSSVVTRCESRHPGGSTFRKDRTTLLKSKPGGWTMQYQALEEWHKADEKVAAHPPGGHDMAWNCCYIRWAKVRHLGTETVKSCGQEWPCDVFSVVIPSPAAGNAGPLTEQILEYRIWRCETFPANDGVVRRDHAWGQRGKETVMTDTDTVIDLDRTLRIGETDYPCVVLKSVTDDDKADSLRETERWICAGIPGGQARQESWKIVAEKRESTGVWEVVEVVARRP